MRYQRKMRSHKQIVVDAGSDEELAAVLGVKVHQPRDWRLRDSIPPEQWLDFANHGFATLEELAAAKKRGPPSGEPQTTSVAAA